jgi:hypothetical protein
MSADLGRRTISQDNFKTWFNSRTVLTYARQLATVRAQVGFQYLYIRQNQTKSASGGIWNQNKSVKIMR